MCENFLLTPEVLFPFTLPSFSHQLISFHHHLGVESSAKIRPNTSLWQCVLPKKKQLLRGQIMRLVSLDVSPTLSTPHYFPLSHPFTVCVLWFFSAPCCFLHHSTSNRLKHCIVLYSLVR